MPETVTEELLGEERDLEELLVEERVLEELRVEQMVMVAKMACSARWDDAEGTLNMMLTRTFPTKVICHF